MPAPKGNKNALGGNGGRPLKYKTEEDLSRAIDDYFKTIKEDEVLSPTVSGLAHHLGFLDRQSIYDYKDRVKFSCIIKKAILYIESIHESNLFNTGASGSIFWLKNHYWKDTQDTNLNVNKLPSLEVEVKKP
jgi:hypothetical protein